MYAIKVFLMLSMLVNGAPIGPPNRLEMPSLEVCQETAFAKLEEAVETTEDAGNTSTTYLAACVVEKVQERPA